MTPEKKLEMDLRIAVALDMAERYGGFDGAHHKMWVIDQMVRALTGCPVTVHDFGACGSFKLLGESEEYREWVRDVQAGEDGPDTYEWETGIAP